MAAFPACAVGPAEVWLEEDTYLELGYLPHYWAHCSGCCVDQHCLSTLHATDVKQAKVGSEATGTHKDVGIDSDSFSSLSPPYFPLRQWWCTPLRTQEIPTTKIKNFCIFKPHISQTPSLYSQHLLVQLSKSHLCYSLEMSCVFPKSLVIKVWFSVHQCSETGIWQSD